MSLLDALILGVVEGITEFLPISSTAHLMITNRLLSLPVTNFVKSFDIIIQLGAILAVVVLYLRRLLIEHATFYKVFLAFIPTAVIGMLLYPIVKDSLLGNLPLAAFALILGGVVMIIFEYTQKNTKGEEKITFRQAFWVGVFQVLALIPGVSRAGATVIGGQSLGVSRKTIVEFSFLLAIPTMIGAAGLDLVESSFIFNPSEWLLLAVGFFAAFATALVAVQFFLRFIEKNSFATFGWYRIVIGLLILFFLL